MSHYDWLNENLKEFFDGVGINIDYHKGVIVAHGDKCYGYKHAWEEAGVPFEHGVAIYLLTYFNPFANEVRQTDDGWVDVKHWVIDNYPKFKRFLPRETRHEQD